MKLVRTIFNQIHVIKTQEDGFQYVEEEGGEGNGEEDHEAGEGEGRSIVTGKFLVLTIYQF